MESSYKFGKRKGFTVVYRSVAQDKRLSLKARGLFLLMQSLPDDWILSQSRLASLAGVGRDQIRAALKELETVGYLIVEQSHDDGGHFAKTVYVLQKEAPTTPPPSSESPTTGKPENAPSSGNPTTGKPENAPSSGNPSTENLSSENPTALDNTICRNTPLPPTGETVCVPEKTKAKRVPRPAPKWKPERFDRFWKYYAAHGRRDNFQGTVKAWDKLRPDDELIDKMALALTQQINGDLWRRGIGIPYASTWLNQRRWENECTDSTPNPAPPSDVPEVTGWMV